MTITRPSGHPTELQDLLDRHRAFWHRSSVDRPVLSTAPWQGYTFYEPFPLEDGSPVPERTALTPGLLSARRYLEKARPTRLIDGDSIRAWELYDVCWMEAMLGCRVIAASGTTWAGPFLFDWEEVSAILDRRPNHWLESFVAEHRLLAEMAGAEYPVGQPLMRGPTDMALAAMGPELFCAGFYEHTDEFMALLETCMRIWLEAADRRYEVIASFYGGYCGRHVWGLWVPGQVLDYQEDATGLLSPKTYREYIAPLDRKMAQQFEYSIMHVHSGQLQMLPIMLEIPELSAIQIAIDPPPFAPPAATFIPQFKAIQSAEKSLLVTGPMGQTELDQILAEVSPVGLALRVGLLSEA